MTEKLKRMKRENFEMKRDILLLKTENCQLTVLSELVQAIEALDDSFEKATFEVIFPSDEHSAFIYSCSFVNFQQAEIYWMKFCQSETEQDRQYWLDWLENEKVFVLQVQEMKN